jgi:hypothetical protein
MLMKPGPHPPHLTDGLLLGGLSLFSVQEVAQEAMLATEDNARKEEENEALRHQLLQVQEQLQAIQTGPAPAASRQVCTYHAERTQNFLFHFLLNSCLHSHQAFGSTGTHMQCCTGV